MQVAFSREDSAVRFVHDDDAGTRFVLEPGRRRRIDELLLQADNAALLCELLSRDADGAGAIFYVCGRADFAASVQRAIHALLAQQVGGDAPQHVRFAALRFRALVAETYKIWARVLYLVVEMENALRLDFTIQQRARGGNESAAARSAYKLRLVLESHQRFLSNCLRGLAGEPLHELWAIACGLGGQDRDIGWMRQALDAIVQGEAARAIDALMSTLEDAISDESGAEPDDRVAEALGAFEAADLLFLHELKLAVREGLWVFEAYQREVAPRGGALLLDLCRRLPGLYAAFFVRAAQALG